MLPADRLVLAIDIHSQSYQLLRWVAEAVRKGFIPATRAHEYANTGDAALDWIQEHYLNFPQGLRPDRRHLREFANFFGTYLTSSFDIFEQPGTRLDSPCGCYCPMCARLVNAPHLRPKKLTRRDKERATRLMVDRVAALAREERIAATDTAVTAIVHGDETRRPAAYSTYGHWLIRRLERDTDGTAVLALWREIAWKRTGSPIPKFRLRYEDFVEAEKVVAEALRSMVEVESGSDLRDGPTTGGTNAKSGQQGQ
jgi:hypothetical protein